MREGSAAPRMVERLHRAEAAVAEAGDPELADALAMLANNGIPLETTLGLAPDWHSALRRRERDAAIVAAAARYPDLKGMTLAAAISRALGGEVGPERVRQILQKCNGNHERCDYQTGGRSFR